METWKEESQQGRVARFVDQNTQLNRDTSACMEQTRGRASAREREVNTQLQELPDQMEQVRSEQACLWRQPEPGAAVTVAGAVSSDE